MRRWWSCIALALCLAGPALAQELAAPLARSVSVLTLDKERVFRESLAGQEIVAAFDLENEALAVEIRQIEAALEAEERDLTNRRAVLPVAEFQALAEAFNKKAVTTRETQIGKAKALERRREEERKAFFQSLVPVLGAIMQDAGALVILDDKAVLVSIGQIDITDEAIRRMDTLHSNATAP